MMTHKERTDCYQDCLDAIDLVMRQFKKQMSAAVIQPVPFKVLQTVSSDKGIEALELRSLALCNLSIAFNRLARPREAKKFRQDAEQLLERIPAPGNIIELEDQLANALMELGQHRAAIMFCEQAVRLSRKSGPKFVGRLWRGGRYYHRAGYKQQAEDALRMALDLRRPDADKPRIPMILFDLGTVLLVRDASEAKRCFEGPRLLGNARKRWAWPRAPG